MTFYTAKLEQNICGQLSEFSNIAYAKYPTPSLKTAVLPLL